MSYRAASVSDGLTFVALLSMNCNTVPLVGSVLYSTDGQQGATLLFVVIYFVLISNNHPNLCEVITNC